MQMKGFLFTVAVKITAEKLPVINRNIYGNFFYSVQYEVFTCVHMEE